MKQLFLTALMLCNAFIIFGEGIEIGLGNGLPPSPRIGEQPLSALSSSTLKKSSYMSTAVVYYPVSAYVDDLALTVTFTQAVGTATVLVYDANNQLIDMVSVDTTNEVTATISTEAWASGAYKLVVNYGNTTLVGNFNF
ncbi:MAG: DUF3244 domain-containing protein [Paludibacter sp.]